MSKSRIPTLVAVGICATIAGVVSYQRVLNERSEGAAPEPPPKLDHPWPPVVGERYPDMALHDLEGRLNVDARIRVGDEVHYDIGLLDETVWYVMNVQLVELEPRPGDALELLRGDVDADDLVLIALDQVLDQMRPDEAAGA